MKSAMVLCGLMLAFAGLVQGHAGRTVQDSQSEMRSNQVLARLSYDSTYPTEENSFRPPLACFELYTNGRYRLYRLEKDGVSKLGGSLSEAQLTTMARMLKKLDFDNRAGGVIRRGSESFVAELARKETTRFIWIDPDHLRPFPESVVPLVRWLQNFPAEGATPLPYPENSADPICPSISDGPMQPLER
jgi:hypothetical protein